MGSFLGDFSERILVLERKITSYNQPGNFPENTRRSTKVISLRRKKQRNNHVQVHEGEAGLTGWLALGEGVGVDGNGEGEKEGDGDGDGEEEGKGGRQWTK